MTTGIPTHLDHYEVIDKLGYGGFGNVYLAADAKLGNRLVVIKVLHPHLAVDPDMVKRFRREAQAMGQLDHPNIVRIYSVKDQLPRPFIVMEFVPGITLATLLYQGVVSFEEALPLLRQIAEALDAAHLQGMVHRDVKPSNVLITPEGVAKLTDFGIVKMLQGNETTLTPTIGTMGSVRYMSPEQVDIHRQDQIGASSDIYALGVIAYQMLAGRVPFEGQNNAAILIAHMATPPPDPSSFNPVLSPAVVSVLTKVLHKEPEYRYTTASLFVQALEQAIAGKMEAPYEEETTSILSPAVKTSSRSWATGLAVLVLLLVGVIVGGIINEMVSNEGFIPSYFPVAGEAITPTINSGASVEVTETPILATETPILVTSTPFVATDTSAKSSQTPLSITQTPDVEPITAQPASPTEAPQPSTATLTSTPTLVPTFTETASASPTEATSTPSFTPTPLPNSTETAEPPTPELPIIGVAMNDGMPEVYVPAGEFLMGNAGGDEEEQPPHVVYLDEFWIDQTEVTNMMYRICVEAGLCNEPTMPSFHPAYTDPSTLNHPVIHVSWDDAKTYCEWAERRLPTEAEWEKAARGFDERLYPWGNSEPTSDKLNLCDQNCSNEWKVSWLDDGYAHSAPVGSYPAGASPYGTLDMAGNVLEWVADWYDEAYYTNTQMENPTGAMEGERRVTRGGAWSDGAYNSRVTHRESQPPNERNDVIGFRCARTP